MGRPRKFKTPEDLSAAWEAYTHECDNIMVLTHKFSAVNGVFITAELRRAITYTIEGFCLYVGLSRQAFYQTYASDPVFVDMATRVRESCECDARQKFELGILPTQLAGLWMTRYGYGKQIETRFTGAVPVVLSGDKLLEG